MMMNGIAFHPDGPYGTLRIHILDLGELIASVRMHVTRSLTVEECQKYLHVDTCLVE